MHNLIFGDCEGCEVMAVLPVMALQSAQCTCHRDQSLESSIHHVIVPGPGSAGERHEETLHHRVMKFTLILNLF